MAMEEIKCPRGLCKSMGMLGWKVGTMLRTMLGPSVGKINYMWEQHLEHDCNELKAMFSLV